MENKQMKCIKGESCLHCGSNYCRFVDELDQLKTENEELKAQLEQQKKGNVELLEIINQAKDGDNSE